MSVLRHNKDSLMAVLEAFVYDPLLNWRLIDATLKTKRSKQTADSSASSSAQEDGLEDALAPSLPKKLPPIGIGQDSGIHTETLKNMSELLGFFFRRKWATGGFE